MPHTVLIDKDDRLIIPLGIRMSIVGTSSRKKRREPIQPDEANAVLSAACRDRSVFGLRDTGIIGLLFGFGIREEQLRELTLDDYDRETGVFCLRSPTHSLVQLPAAARLIVDRWISARGLGAGPLFNPILRPNRIIPKALNESGVGAILTRRALQAGVRPFSPGDVVGTHSLLTDGRWDLSRSLHAPVELFPLIVKEDPSNGEFDVSFTSSTPLAAEIGNGSSRLLVSFLTRYIPGRRSVLKRNLDALAREITAGKCDAACVDWCTLSAGRLPSRESVMMRFGMRKVHAMRNAFYGLLKEGLAIGVIDKLAYSKLRKTF